MPVAGPRSLAAGASPLAWPDPGAGQRSGRDGRGSDRSVSAQTIRAEGPDASSIGAPEPEIPTFRVVLRSSQGIASRSVEGVASSDYTHSLGAITDAVIDLRGTPIPRVIVNSEQDLHLLSLSVLNDAALKVNTQHTGLQQASLLLGSEANTIVLRFNDSLDLALLAGGTARGQIHQSLIGLQDSRLEDAGGDASLELSSLTGFQLKGPEAQQLRQVNIDLLAEAMRNSAILLGGGNDRVTITSGFRTLDPAGADLLIDLPGAGQTAGTPAPPFQARSLALVDSLLDTGGGNDQVSITTAPEGGAATPSGAGLQRIALLDSTVRLGAGDDRLQVDGDVIGSRIDLGGGVNALQVRGAVQDANVQVDAGSSNAIQLGNGGNTVTIGVTGDGGADLTLNSGAGDDRIRLPMGALTGSVDGGAGIDTLEDRSGAEVSTVVTGADPAKGSPEPEPLAVTLAGEGEGSIGGLAFQGIENLSLGERDTVVSVGSQGTLDGVLAAGSGEDRLDYATWQNPVQVDLSRGEASGILGGVSGFEEVRGGAGDDVLTAGATTRRLDGGAGDDRLELDLSSIFATGDSGNPPLVVVGGPGRDQFVLAGVDAIRTIRDTGSRALPVLADLALSPENGGGGLGLTDRLSLRLSGIQAASNPQSQLIDLTPSGVEGIGQARLLPIAPLDQLVAGIGERPAGFEQLAIATGATGSSLVLLGSGGSVTGIADLPALHAAGSPLDHGAAEASPAVLAA
ncbi:MAG: hypothetical protein ER33_04640 [Cyanobium sp. CACIAM 14]|nr:MAG: hypothetical protein ER33_04640 [Cyanobium sp. CACIAM 14]